jgi:hypothetical protein
MRKLRAAVTHALAFAAGAWLAVSWLAAEWEDDQK